MTDLGFGAGVIAGVMAWLLIMVVAGILGSIMKWWKERD